MVFPHYNRKHREKSLFNPYDFIQYKELWKHGPYPQKYILTYHDSALRHFQRKYKPKKIHLYSLLTIYVYKDLGFVKMTGIGSPNAAAVMEELVALGGKFFLNIGTAGGLNREGVFLCTKALRDEGTSHHYLPFEKFSYPHQDLTRRLKSSLRKFNIEFREGITWTIDAPYRETNAEIQRYRQQGIATVEMETSALFAVATYRKVKIAAAFVVSDLLGKKWLPKFHRFDVRKTQNLLIDVAIDCLQSMKQ